jgi:transcriptional regulator with XRE-family HTH domain
MDDTANRADKLKPGKKLLEVADKAVADHIRAERARAGLTQAQLGEIAGMTPITVHRLETAQRPLSLAQLFAICQALKIAPGDFLNAAQENVRE